MTIDKYNNSVHAKDTQSWRQWLATHHSQRQAVWLIIIKKESEVPSVYYNETVDEALCFGWVDSKPNKRDDDSYYLYFSQRNPKSNWSKVNKDKVEKLMLEKKLAPAGLKMIALAKENGTWTTLDALEKIEIPTDLQQALESVPNAMQYFQAFPKSSKRNILEWILNAKIIETRHKRITETAELAAENIRANHYRQPKKK